MEKGGEQGWRRKEAIRNAERRYKKKISWRSVKKDEA